MKTVRCDKCGDYIDGNYISNGPIDFCLVCGTDNLLNLIKWLEQDDMHCSLAVEFLKNQVKESMEMIDEQNKKEN